MIKIVALNDEDEDETNEEDELVATREAQETIAESEYIRAIKLKSEGEVDLCLHLLKELLQTQVLNENTDVKNNRNDKLWNIKYNCHKNIAFILEDRCEYMMALQHYISAILIDNTDVSTLHKFGQLALKLKATDLAEYAFENCLGRNAAHWCAAEGMLEVMNINHNIMGSFNCAGKILQQDVNCEKAEETLREIKNLFGNNLQFLKNCSGMGGGIEIEENNNNQFKQLFDGSATLKDIKEDICEKKPELKDFYIKNVTWRSIGEFIVQVYEHLKKIEHNMLFTFNFNDIIDSNGNDDPSIEVNKDITDTTNNNGESMPQNSGDLQDEVVNNTESAVETAKPITTENPDAPQPMEFNNNEDSDSNAKSDGGEANKSKPKRRCSDLHFLEQWGWHKNRRYSSRKKTERDEIDTSLNGYLRKIFEKYTNTQIVDKWPFSREVNEDNSNSSSLNLEVCKDCEVILTEEEFNMKSQDEFEKFLNNLKEKTNIDLMEMVYKWLKYISSVWFLPLPEDLKNLYIEIFEIYTTHFSFSSWHFLTPQNYEACYRICLLYLELEAGKNHLNNENNSLWSTVFHHLLFNLGNMQLNAINSNCMDNQEIFKLKLIILEYLKLNKEERIAECVTCLQQMSAILEEQESSFILHLPNLTNICCLNLNYIKNLQLKYKRQIDINSIPKLYEQQSWDKLQSIIISNLESSEENKHTSEAWLKDICAQIKILLQSFWLMESYENCLLWAEKSLHFSVTHYLKESKSFYRSSTLAQLINFINSYLEAIILNEGFHIVNVFSKEDLARLIHNIIRILVYQFDGTFEKNSNHGHELNFKRSWVILHQLLHKEENDNPNTLSNKTTENEIVDVNELIPKSFLLLFTAHDYLGKRQWCTDDNGEFLQYVLDTVVLNLKAPIYDNCRDVIYEYLEQVTYCLFKYPQKKARQRHLEDHEAVQIKLCWPKAVQIFDLYRPEDLPEFNSYKLESITSDMEQLLNKTLTLMPKELDPSKSIHHVTMFIEGQTETPPSEANAFKLPYKILSLYYLLADYYFKNRDFLKAIKFYTLDLAVNPTRYDSWAGIALSKASKIETKLNGLDPINMDTLWEEYEEVLRCFECCININRFQALLWIEHGSFSYTIHSCFSRYLKSNKDKLSAENMAVINERKEKTLSIAYNCFKLANSLQNAPSPTTAIAANGANTEDNNDDDDGNDEKWLCQYMLGKISEKRKEEPKVYLNHYLMAANYLYESSATYPIKINHNNPTTLSVEALEVFYRINAAMIKYLQNEKDITRATGDLFRKILKNLSNSPFAYNKAKIDGNSLNILKGKILNKAKPPTANDNTKPEATNREISNNTETLKTLEDIQQAAGPTMVISSGTSSVMSSDSSTVESDSDSEDESTNDNANGTFKPEKLKLIYGMVVQNIEECVTRFPEHYKSIYRLVYHYMNAPKEYCDLTQSEQLLIGQYKTTLGNLVNGLFYDRKNNNLFNGIWRIPSSEIDRPGSFSAHLVKCVKIFIQQLYKTNNHALLLDLAMNLYKTPDLDKRYITDSERKELCNQSINYCVQILRGVLQRNMEKRDDVETLNLLIDIYKIHKKCIKYMNQKEPLFAELLVEVYKYFIKNKVDYIPENCNFLDLAIKLCVQEITAQKNLEKSANADSDYIVTQSTIMQQYGNNAANRVINIPGLSNRPKYRASTTKTSTSTTSATPSLATQNPLTMPIPDFTKNPQFLSMFGVFGNSANPLAARDTPEFQKLFEEFYAKIIQNTNEQAITPTTTSQIPYNPLQQTAIPSNLLLPNQTSTNTTTTNLTESSIFVPTSNADDNLLQNLLTSQTNKQQSKPKATQKNKTNVFKPYTRPDSNPTAAHDINPSNYKIDMFSNPANVLAAYSNLLQNTTLTQMDFSNKTSANAKKSKHNLAEPSNSYLSNMATKERQPDIKTTMSYNLPSTSFASTMQSRNQFTPHPPNTNSPNQVSPTKTLQEKLAERQKAYQLSENNSKPTINVDSSNDDVIVLD